MKKAIKIIKIVGAIIIAFMIMMTVVALILSDKMGSLILNSVNSKIPVKIETESFRLSFIRRFPNASLEFKNITVFSAPSFNKNEFSDISVDTFLYASSISMEFSIADIINKKYNIGSVNIKQGKLFILKDSSEANNYGIAKTGDSLKQDNFILDLNKITLSDVEVIYNDLNTSIFMNSWVEKGRLTSRITRNEVIFNTETDIVINYYQHKDFTLNNPLSVGLDVNLDRSNDGLNIRRGRLFVEGVRFGLTGSVSSENNMNLKISGEKINLQTIRKYLPSNYAQKLREYDLRGTLTVESSITGKISKTENPHFELSYLFENGSARRQLTGLSADKIYLRGSFSNGVENSKNSSVITVNELRANIGSGNVNATFKVNDFNNPFADIKLQGRIYPGEVKQFFGIAKMPYMSGYCDVDLSLKSLIPKNDNQLATNLLRLKPTGRLTFYDINTWQTDNIQLLSNVNGEIILSEHLTANNFQFEYKNQKTTVDGTFKNLQEWLAGSATIFNANASIHFENLTPEILTLFQRDEQTIKMPHDVSFDLRLKVDSFTHDRLSASDVEANLVYNQGLLTFNSLNIKAFDGVISGNGYILQDSKKQFISKGIFNVAALGVKKTFTAFRNFGQTFIQAENLDGDFTGSVTLFLPADSMFKIDAKSVVAEGKFVIANGSLVDFEPVKKLSSYIELSELENIRFSKLENDFFIRNNQLTIPQMEVLSSAADFSINGRHGFDKNFEYHIRVKLSELLSNRRRNTQRSVTEFGAVEDDGLGRTTLFLLAQGTGNTTRISYDMRAARDKVREDVQAERQNLRTILNQEYGLFRNDPAVTQPQQQAPPENNRPRFRIEWDDSGAEQQEQVPPERENPVRNLFRRR